MWVFGYGSLVWNPGFHYDEKVLGFIKGYKRVFDLGKALFLLVFLIDLYRLPSYWWFFCVWCDWLACIDHRGTPEHPARTCTLEIDEEAICVSINSKMYNMITLFLTNNPILCWQWGTAFCVRGGPEEERLAMEVCLCIYKLDCLMFHVHPFVLIIFLMHSTWNVESVNMI